MQPCGCAGVLSDLFLIPLFVKLNKLINISPQGVRAAPALICASKSQVRKHMSTDSDVLPEYGHTPPVEAPLCSLTFRDGMVWTFSFVLLILQ